MELTRARIVSVGGRGDELLTGAGVAGGCSGACVEALEMSVCGVDSSAASLLGIASVGTLSAFVFVSDSLWKLQETRTWSNLPAIRMSKVPNFTDSSETRSYRSPGHSHWPRRRLVVRAPYPTHSGSA